MEPKIVINAYKKLSLLIMTLSKNNKTIPLNPIRTPIDFNKESFSSEVRDF